jgi:hypothetical protein
MKVETINGLTETITLSRYRELKANAFAMGTLGEPRPGFLYKFCHDAYEAGREADLRLREEIETRQR